MRWARVPVAVVVLGAVAMSLPAASDAASHSVRVTRDYFSASYPLMAPDTQGVRDRQLAAIRHAGIRSIHETLTWAAIEPTPPSGNQHHYDFTLADRLVRNAAKHHLRIDALFAYTPPWDSAATGTDALFCQAFNAISDAPADTQYYALAAGATAARYGPGGTFWAAHPELPALPIVRWEIWNEPNLTGYWCPGGEPARYADLFVQAASEIRKADPTARLVLGDLPLASPSGEVIDVKTFLGQALAHRPKLLKHVSDVGIHPYPHGSLSNQLLAVKMFRSALTSVGIPKSMPMLATEIGWSTRGPDALTDADRAARYRSVTKSLPRSNCNVSGMVAYAWTTAEAQQGVTEDWYGIADPITAVPYGSARAWAKSVAVESGKGPREAPFKLVRACKGMPPPDQDGDRVPDSRDYFPTDSTRAVGPLSWRGYRTAVKGCRKSLHRTGGPRVKRCVQRRITAR